MSTDNNEGHLYALFESVGNLKGQLDTVNQALLASLAAAQQRDAANSERIEGFERRLNNMEVNLVTKDDLKVLSAEVGLLAKAVSEGQGKDRAMGRINSQAAAWAAVVAGLGSAVIALLALVNSGRNTREILHQERRTPPPPVIQQIR